jgi:hypothetical protein
MPKVNSLQTSTQNVFKNNRDRDRAINGMWRAARTAPMFCKEADNGKKMYTRLINPNAYKIAVSGACAAASGELDSELASFGMNALSDSKNSPFTCSLSVGAAFQLEQFLASVVQEIVHKNKIIRTGIKKHSRNEKQMTKIAIQMVKESIFDPANGVPSSTTVLPMMMVRKKKNQKTSAGEEEAKDPVVEEEKEEDEDEDEDGEDENEENEENEE